MEKIVLYILVLTFVTSCTSFKKQINEYHADVIVYGGSSVAVIAAVEVAQTGKSVIVDCPVIDYSFSKNGKIQKSTSRSSFIRKNTPDKYF